MNKHVKYLVLGAGPTGLGAATRLQDRGVDDYLVIDAASIFGGLASSWIDENGFTWDIGGHVQFSHYKCFDEYMLKALGEDGWYHHQRESWVWIKKRWVPYPFQNNLHRLPPEAQWECVKGLLDASKSVDETRPGNFLEWMKATFGDGVTKHFMEPYNFKVWAFPPEEMMYQWIGERVAVPALEGVLKSVCTGEDAVSWGPNATFRFPKTGGTGSVWKAIGEMLPEEKVLLNTKIQGLDLAAKKLTDESGNEYTYEQLISTIPLNKLLELIGGELEAVKEGLKYSATNVVGVGLKGQPPESLKTKCWMYFPEDNSPYYRVTVFSNYSENNVPKPGEQWSLMTETSESVAKPVDLDNLIEDTVRALIEDQMIPEGTEILSREHRRLAQGYPTPYSGRDEQVMPILKELEGHDVYSRGRFGAWKYEVANQDHSFAQGYECVERLINGGGEEYEPTMHTPSVVNARQDNP